MTLRLVGLLLLALAGACSAPPTLPHGFLRHATESPEGQPVRLSLLDDRITAVAAPCGPSALDATLHFAVEAIEPGGTEVYVAREWGPRGFGFRVEKEYANGAQRDFRSVLLSPTAEVLERTHGVPVGETPQPVLLAAMAAGGRNVERIEAVSGSSTAQTWRVTVRDGAGNKHVVECDDAGNVTSTVRVLSAQVTVPD
jgi:hypothetical protein